MSYRQREAYVSRKMDTCKHFTGIQHEKCKLGISYETFKNGIPCCESSQTKAECDRRECWTKDEAESLFEDAEQATVRFLQAAAHVHQDAKTKGYGKGKGGNDSCSCPVCGKTIRYSVASLNGHIWASCETKGCVRWME